MRALLLCESKLSQLTHLVYNCNNAVYKLKTLTTLVNEMSEQTVDADDSIINFDSTTVIRTEDTSTPEEENYTRKLISINSEVVAKISQGWDDVGMHLAVLLEHLVECRNGQAIADLYIKLKRSAYGNKTMADKIRDIVYHYFALVIKTTPNKDNPVKHHFDKDREKGFKIVGKLVSPRNGKQTELNEFEGQLDIIKLLKNSAKEDDKEQGFRWVLKLLEDATKDPSENKVKVPQERKQWQITKEMKNSGSFSSAFNMACIIFDTIKLAPEHMDNPKVKEMIAALALMEAKVKEINLDILKEASMEKAREAFATNSDAIPADDVAA